MTRRAVLRAGSVGALGLGLPALLQHRARAEAGADGFGRAKACIFLFMWGGPSQLDTFDPKPDAPQEVRGPFQPIATAIPGVQFSELFTRTAALADRLAVIRSLTHNDPAHLSSAHCTLTGQKAPVFPSDAVPPSDRDSPHLGSILARARGGRNGLPPFVTMPWLAYHPAAPGGRAPGQHGGWLGHKYDPLLIEGDPSRPDWKVPALSLMDHVSTQRLLGRGELLEQLDQQRRALDSVGVASMSEFQQQAFGLLTAPAVREAFDLGREPDGVRDRYGRNIHGQCVLLARRLVERGVSLVSVNWHDDGKAFWDTHGNNFERLKNDLVPPADQALTALLEDLESRGLLGETIVAWVGEFGRKPQITAGNAGREHHPHCYSGLLAGGGIRGGALHGRSDGTAGYPAESPVSPEDYAATLLHALGFHEHAAFPDALGRPRPIYAGTPIRPLFG
ncbi:MAG: DUF1501 domain-containing protein [Planctomycetaceae bacterium]